MAALALPDCAKHFGNKGPSSTSPGAELTNAVFNMPGSRVLFGLANPPVIKKDLFMTTAMVGEMIPTSDPWAYWAADHSTRVYSTAVEIDINVSAWNATTTIERAKAFIHELGHVFDELPGLGGSDFIYDVDPITGKPTNDPTNSQIMKDCISG
jgi:hypothetical protein